MSCCCAALLITQGVTNIYTQHSPLLSRTLDECSKGTLQEASYPFLEGTPTKVKPQLVIEPPSDSH